MGATFADYLVTVHEGGKNLRGIGGEGIETLLYVTFRKSNCEECRSGS